MSKKLAYTCKARTEMEEAKKAMASDFKAKIDELAAQISLLSNHINNGWEFRPVDCVVTMNMPKDGMKTLFRIDTQQFVSEEKMSADELQGKLPLEVK